MKNPNLIRLGMIGMTDGNGHPYSWSAIFNRYNREAMTAECPFPGIPTYLNKENYTSIGIPGAEVRMVYCDRRENAEHIARLSNIPEVAERPEDMIGKVDAVIIATDIGAAPCPSFPPEYRCSSTNRFAIIMRIFVFSAKLL